MRSLAVIRVLSAVLLVVGAVAAGLLSYHSLHGLAVEQQIPGDFTWLWPICIDAMLIVGTLVILYDELTHASTTVGWLIVLGGTAFSAVVQALQVPDPTLLSVLVWGLPPLSMAITLWLLMRMVRRHLRPVSGRGARTRRASQERTAPDPARVGDRSQLGHPAAGAGTGSGHGTGHWPSGSVEPEVLPTPQIGHVDGSGEADRDRDRSPVAGAAQRTQTGPGVWTAPDMHGQSGDRETTRARARRIIAEDRAHGRKTTGPSLAAALGGTITPRQAQRHIEAVRAERPLHVVGE